MKSEFELAVAQIAADKGLDTDDVLEAVRAAVKSAYLDLPGSIEDVSAEVDAAGDFKIYANRTVVGSIMDDSVEISLDDSQKLDPSAQVGEVIQVDITPKGFSRIAAQKARQTMLQTLKQSERLLVVDQYAKHVGELLVGKVSRIDNRGTLVEFGRAEALLPFNEQISTERLRINQRIRVLLVDVIDVGRGPQLIVSRSNPDFVRRLFENEIPEISNNVVEIVNIARDAGLRTKVAVRSLQEGLDPVGSCVGIRGARIQAIVRDLVPEKVEIIEFSEDSVSYIANSLSPAKVQSVGINVEQNLADVLVQSDMVSLAIGRDGQNARLAARLTGWRINIRDASAPDTLKTEADPESVQELDGGNREDVPLEDATDEALSSLELMNDDAELSSDKE